ncbi:hypothetical protein ES703_99432 [subsurface metagenome]
MKLNTRVFELYKGRYGSVPKLALAMGVSRALIHKVKQGKRGIGGRFIIGAIRAFPEYNLGDLFYVNEGQLVKSSNNLPGFREYARQKYPNELDEDLATVIEYLIERRRAKHKGVFL